MSEPALNFEPLRESLCLVVIVTHDSEASLQWCLDGLDSSASNLAVRIVDSGSSKPSYLDRQRTRHRLEVRKATNIGFVAANNAALGSLGNARWILFLNPDARIEGTDLDTLVQHAERQIDDKTAIFTVPLIRFDIQGFKPLDRYDSVGIGSTWYGRWIDRLSGEPVRAAKGFSTGRWSKPEAICGAFMLVRATALSSVPDSTGSPGFERRYYMYKEDIELCLRMRSRGWRLALVGHLHAYHCRGWNKSRGSVPYWARLESSRNDLDIARRYAWRSLPFAFAKFLYVKTLERG